MVNDFDRQTKEKAAGRTCALLMDGHSSHYSLELIHFAQANNIIIIGYPPHCAHILQGLDVVCFAKMKHQFRAEIKKFENLHHHGVMKEDFAGVFGWVFLQAFDEDTVKAAFSATGVWPYNPDAIRDERLKPSLPTSIKGSFPIPQSSPVHAIISVLGGYRPTAFECSPTHFAPIPSSTHLPMSTSSSLTFKWRPHNDDDGSDSVIDPTLRDSPLKQMQILHGTLGSTSSGSLLLSTPRLTSYNPANPTLQSLPPLPQPDWSLLNQSEPDSHQTREMVLARLKLLTESLRKAHTTIAANHCMEEANNAQIILQHLEVTKCYETTPIFFFSYFTLLTHFLSCDHHVIT